jgi:RHS repeat-associated protein
LKRRNTPSAFASHLKGNDVRPDKGKAANYSTLFREYDAPAGRWWSTDPARAKTPWESPYVGMGNNPISNVDLLGDVIYTLFYQVDEAGQSNFEESAETRKREIENREWFNKEKDIVISYPLRNLSDIKGDMETIKSIYSDKYGKTAEVGIWSHGSFDGPRGTEEAKSEDRFAEEGGGRKQMKIESWASIDFNWSSDAQLILYGCRTGKKREDGLFDNESFAQRLSGQKNMLGIKVFGQEGYAYPSKLPSSREASIMFSFHAKRVLGDEVYMVGGEKGFWEYVKSLSIFSSGTTYPMNTFKNGFKLGTEWQPYY